MFPVLKADHTWTVHYPWHNSSYSYKPLSKSIIINMNITYKHVQRSPIGQIWNALGDAFSLCLKDNASISHECSQNKYQQVKFSFTRGIWLIDVFSSVKMTCQFWIYDWSNSIEFYLRYRISISTSEFLVFITVLKLTVLQHSRFIWENASWCISKNITYHVIGRKT